jgi:hypothetical protein
MRPSDNASGLYPELLGLNLVKDTDLRTDSDYFTAGRMALTDCFV